MLTFRGVSRALRPTVVRRGGGLACERTVSGLDRRLRTLCVRYCSTNCGLSFASPVCVKTVTFYRGFSSATSEKKDGEKDEKKQPEDDKKTAEQKRAEEDYDDDDDDDDDDYEERKSTPPNIAADDIKLLTLPWKLVLGRLLRYAFYIASGFGVLYGIEFYNKEQACLPDENDQIIYQLPPRALGAEDKITLVVDPITFITMEIKYSIVPESFHGFLGTYLSFAKRPLTNAFMQMITDPKSGLEVVFWSKTDGVPGIYFLQELGVSLKSKTPYLRKLPEWSVLSNLERNYLMTMLEDSSDGNPTLLSRPNKTDTPDSKLLQMYVLHNDQQARAMRFPLLSFEHCRLCGVIVKDYVKDLRILNRDFSKIINLDDARQSFYYQRANGLFIPSYFGGNTDNAILKIWMLLDCIRAFKVKDVRPVLERYRDRNKLTTLEDLFGKGNDAVKLRHSKFKFTIHKGIEQCTVQNLPYHTDEKWLEEAYDAVVATAGNYDQEGLLKLRKAVKVPKFG